MKYFEGTEVKIAEEFLNQTVIIAKNATCNRSKCGSIIVKDGTIIGTGSNSPPNNVESQRRCSNKKASYDIKVTDKTCCVHAEQRAIMNALQTNPDKIVGSTLYFIRLDENNNPTTADAPYCTICSKMALDTGIKEFVLLHEQGLCSYDTEEYNDLSFGYDG